MRIYTSSFRKAQNRQSARTLVASVSNSQPKTSHLPVLDVLVPSWKLITEPYRETIQKAESLRPKTQEEADSQMALVVGAQQTYTFQYKAHLKANRDKIRAALQNVQQKNPDLQNLVLTCWEDDNEFCHRHIARQWMVAECADVLCPLIARAEELALVAAMKRNAAKPKAPRKPRALKAVAA